MPSIVGSVISSGLRSATLVILSLNNYECLIAGILGFLFCAHAAFEMNLRVLAAKR